MVKSSVRKFLLLSLLSFPAQAQVVGWIDCRHTLAGERFGYIKVALMDGNREVRSVVRDFSVLKPGRNDILFREMIGPAQLTGMRLNCEIIVPESANNGIASEESGYTVNWVKPLDVPLGVTIKPALALILVEVTPGSWRAYIGKAP